METLPFHLYQLEQSVKQILEIQQKSTVGNLDIWITHILKIKDEIRDRDITKFLNTTYKFLIDSLQLDFNGSKSIFACLNIEFYIIHILLCENCLTKKSSDTEWLKLGKYDLCEKMKYSIYDSLLIQFINNVYYLLILYS